jgi:hypothetical protein
MAGKQAFSGLIPPCSSISFFPALQAGKQAFLGLKQSSFWELK